MPSDIADRMERDSADFARAFGDGVRHSEDLRRLLVEQQVVIPKMGSAHVPVKILRLYVKRENVREEFTEFA